MAKKRRGKGRISPKKKKKVSHEKKPQGGRIRERRKKKKGGILLREGGRSIKGKGGKHLTTKTWYKERKKANLFNNQKRGKRSPSIRTTRNKQLILLREGASFLLARGGVKGDKEKGN